MFKRTALLNVLTLLCLLAPAAAAAASVPGLMAPSKLDFGPVDVHFGGVPHQSVQVTNMSGEEIALGTLTVSGADGPGFPLSNDGCSGQPLKAFTSCTVEVGFQPGTAGARGATLEIPAGESSVSVALTGTGTTGTLSASPTHLRFGPIPYTPPGTHHGEGEQNETEQVTVADTPDAGVQAGAVTITGPDASSFSIQYGNCEGDLMGPNNTCGMGIGFQPTSPGPKHATLTVANDGSGGDLAIPLEGEGREGPRFLPSTSQALLGEVGLGDSRSQTFTIANGGDYPLFIQQSFIVTGTPLMFPRTSDTCSGQIVEPGSTCEITIVFAPTTAGPKSAALLVITNATPAINVLGIDGVGAGPSVAPTALAGAIGVARPLISAPHVDRLAKLHGGTLRTRIVATCPGGQGHCQAVSFLTTALPVHASSRRGLARLAVLGSGTLTLRERESSSVQVRLRPKALLLLRRRRHLTVTLTTLLRSRSGTIATHTTILVLTAPRATVEARAPRR